MKALSASEAFSEGADVWVMADHRQSPWTGHVDYYLGYSLLRARQFVPKQLDQALQTIISENEIDSKPAQKIDGENTLQPLMVDSRCALPARMVVHIPDSVAPEAWLEYVAKIWQGLQKPKIRLFLPKGLKTNSSSAGFRNGLEQLETVSAESWPGDLN